MYNRYIPQSDGTYRRNRIQESQPEPSKPAPPMPEPNISPREPDTLPCSKCMHMPPLRPAIPPKQRKPSQPPAGAGSFLRNLLPKNFDTEDLLIVLLLLLIAGDCQDDSNSALLTLVLYLFL